MANLNSNSDKSVLIIDDMSDMRSSLRSQVGSLNITNVGVAASIKDALELIKQKRFDVILCDYYLGGATDGQQFLEYLRTSNIISRATLFIMITAETGYESVITAAECLPDDYLLKPFTADTLHARFDRLLEKKSRLAAIDKLQDRGAWLEIITACDGIISMRDKYLIDAMRIKGNALHMSAQIDEAIQFYQQALALRDMPWAKLGLAKALKEKGDSEQAKQLLLNVISANPNLLSAYDLLGKIHTEAGNDEAALAILDRACSVAPNSLARQRSIAAVAEKSGDFKRVEQALATVLRKTRNSPLRDTADYAKLSHAYAEMGDTSKALAVIDEAKTTFKGDSNLRSVFMVEAIAQQKAGKPEQAAAALDQALAGGAQQLPEATAMLLAKACLANGRSEQAMTTLKTVLQDNPDSAAVKNSVSQLLAHHGGEEAAQALIAQSAQEVVNLNNEAVLKARAGNYTDSARMLTDAALRLPNNIHILSNAALSLLVDVFMNGIDAAKIQQAKYFQQSIVKIDKQYAKLAEISAFLAKIQAKYKLETLP